MSILTFSETMINRFGNVIYPELHKRLETYNNYFKIKSTDNKMIDIENWLIESITKEHEILSKIVDREGWNLSIDSNDDIMQSITYWVKKNVTYTSDYKTHLMDDYWQTPGETLQLRTGDCEDGATLIIALAYVTGINSNRYWLQWGEVIGGGHCYVCYLRDTDAEEIVLDWCYYWVPILIKLRGWFGEDKKYKQIWGTASIF